MQYFKTLFSSGPYMPHGYCFLWNPGLIGLHVVSDLLIALSYLSIPLTLAYIVHKRRDLPFRWMFICFGVVILACGATHGMDVWTLWHANYWVSGSIKAITAMTSLPTAILLVKLIPYAVALPAPAAMRLKIAPRKHAQEALSLKTMELEVSVQERIQELRKVNEDLMREIELRKQLQQTLEDRKEQLRLAQEASGLGVWDWDPRADNIVWSAQHSRIFGFEPSQRKLDLISSLALIHPEDQLAVRLAMREALRPGGEWESEYRILRQDGQIRWMMSKGRTRCDDHDRPLRMIGVTLDVSEHRQAAEELRRSEERFRLLVEGINDYAIYMLDPAGFISSWNRGAEHLNGYSAQEILGQHFSRFYIDQDLREGKPALSLREAAAKGRFEEDGWLLRKDGSRFPAYAILTSLHDQHGKLIGFAKITRDLTESRRAAEAVQAAQAELARVVRATTLGELAASIVHEINQPLAAIVNNANASRRILANPAPDLEEVSRAVEDIAEAGTRTGEIISWVLALLKKTAPERRPLDINHVIHDVLALVSSVLENHQVSVQTELMTHLPMVLADRVQLQQVLINLIMNGVEAMNLPIDQPRVLMIRSDARDSGVEVTVRDSGPGLDTRNMPHIFDSYFTTKASGMGMGLSISRSIMEAHSGKIWASLDPAAKGATFHFSLPAMG